MTMVLFFKAAARAKARPLQEEQEDDEVQAQDESAVDAGGGDPAADGLPDKDGADDDRADRGDEQPASLGEGFGPHNVEEGHHVAFTAGAFQGRGKVAATGDDGCTVCDETGREHRVHWHEVTGHHATEGDA